MHTETSKIALACFIGGALCVAVALIVAPNFWWLGCLAGMAGGYICYDVAEIRRSVPIAWRATHQWSRDTRQATISWLSGPHPFLYPGLGIAAVVWTWTLGPIFLKGVPVSVVSFVLTLYFITSVMVSGLWCLFASIGAQYVERCYWESASIWLGEDMTWFGGDIEKLEAKGYSKAPVTYTNVVRWTAKGVGFAILTIVVLFPYTMLKLAWQAVYSFVQFGWKLFKLVHSHKRVLCAIDGTIGGTVSYLWLAPTATTLPEQLLLVAFGGLLGAGLGILNWKIVSRRILGYN